MWAHCILVCSCPYLVSNVLDHGDWGISEIRETCQLFLSTYWDLCMKVSGQTHYILVCLAHSLPQMCLISEIEKYIRSEGHASQFWTHIMTWACKLACTCTIFLRALGNFMAQLCWIKEIDVSIGSGGHSGNFRAHIETCACVLVHNHTIFLCAWANILSQWCHIREIDVSFGSGRHTCHFWSHLVT